VRHEGTHGEAAGIVLVHSCRPRSCRTRARAGSGESRSLSARHPGGSDGLAALSRGCQRQPRHPRRHRRVHARCGRDVVLHHHLGPRHRQFLVRPPPGAQLHGRSRQPGGARHLRRHVPVLTDGAAVDSLDRIRRICLRAGHRRQRCRRTRGGRRGGARLLHSSHRAVDPGGNTVCPRPRRTVGVRGRAVPARATRRCGVGGGHRQAARLHHGAGRGVRGDHRHRRERRTEHRDRHRHRDRHSPSTR
jgi:hypothetical protein